MMSELMVNQLKARFDLQQHEVRKGGSGQWFVYLKKQAIINRLDEVAPMDWQTKIISSIRIDDRVEVVMEMTVAGKTRSYDGVAEDNRRKGKDGKPDILFPLNTAKAATTDGFKRAAQMFGVGLYLLDCPIIKASNEKDAFGQFEKWYQQGASETQHNNGNSPQSEESQPTEPKWATRNTVMPIMKKFRAQGLSDTEIFELAGVTAFNDPAWNNRTNAAEAIATIESNFAAHLESLERDGTPLVGSDAPGNNEDDIPF